MRYLYNVKTIEVFNSMASARVLMAVALALAAAALLVGCAGPGVVVDPSTAP